MSLLALDDDILYGPLDDGGRGRVGVLHPEPSRVLCRSYAGIIWLF